MAGSTCRSVLAAVVARNDGTNGLRQRFNRSTYRGNRLETTLQERGHIILAIVLDIIGKLTQGPGSFHLELGALETPQEAFHLQFQSGKCGGSRR